MNYPGFNVFIMEKKFMIKIFITLQILTTVLFAQIPNPGFEDWNNNQPVGWETINSPGFFMPVEKTNDKHSGAAAVKGTVVSFSGLNVTPFISSFFKMDSRPASISGFYKFNRVGNDLFLGVLYFYNQNNMIGYTEFSLEPTESYISFKSQIEYFDQSIPDTCYAEFFITDTTGDNVNLGSAFYLDQLSFDNVSALPGFDESPVLAKNISLVKNYPNPFNPQTRIRFTLAEHSLVNIDIFDSAGRFIEKVVADSPMNQGEHEVVWDAGNYPSGIYFFRISDDISHYFGKMTLLK